MNTLPVITSILHLFLIIGIGFVARKLMILDDGRVHWLSHILVNIALPALTISSMQVPLSETTIGITESMLFVALAYYFGAFFISIAICHFIPATREEKGIFQFILVFPNVGFMGIPILMAILGPKSLFYVILFNLPFYLLAFTLGIYLITQGSSGKLYIRVLYTPGFVASVMGLFFLLFGYIIPAPASTALDLVGTATTPLAMIVVGALLATLPISRLAGDWRVAVITALRLIIFPILSFFILSLFVHDEMLLKVTVLLIAMPAASNTILFAEEYNEDPILASQGIFISTLFCLVTIPLIVILLF